MTVIEDTESTAERLREDLVDLLIREYAIHTAAIEQAVRTLPRELFLPGVPLTDIYAMTWSASRRQTASPSARHPSR